MTAIYLIIDNVLFLIYNGLGYFLDTTDIFGSELFGIIHQGFFFSACTIFTNIIMVGWFKMRLIHIVIMLPIVHVMNLIRVSVVLHSEMSISDALFILILLVPMSVLYFTGYFIGYAISGGQPTEKYLSLSWYNDELKKLIKLKSDLVSEMENASEETKNTISLKNKLQIADIDKKIERYKESIEKVRVPQMMGNIPPTDTVEQAQNKEEDPK